MSRRECDELKRGWLQQLPDVKYNVVRLYICSTFTDMAVERTYLFKNVYPKLHQYCLENYALQFHPVDLRLGQTCLEADDHDTLQLCLDEIRLCQSMSVGPKFVLLLGQKYGTVMIPRSIAEDEFYVLRKCMQGSERTFIDTWYVKDTNAIPPVYVLQPRYNKQGIIWALVEARIRDQLQEAAIVCVANQLLTDEQAKPYFNSSLEQEVKLGILDCADAEQQCLLFTRSMNNVNPEHKNARDFVDIVDDDIDPLAQRQLLDLVDQKLFEKLPAFNIYQYENLQWADTERGGVCESAHAQYLKDLATDFEAAVKRLIDVNVTKRPDVIKDDVYTECLQHFRLVQQYSSMFFGRREELRLVEDYVKGRLSGAPLVLYGHAGCGKTAILAQAAAAVNGWVEKKKVFLVVRFLGKTPASSDISALLKSLTQNIVDIISAEVVLPREFTSLPSSFEELSSLLKSLLKLIPKEKKLVLILDSIDELKKSSNAFDLSWLPMTLPVNVKIITSVLDEGYDFIETLKHRDFPLSNFVNIPGLTSQASLGLLKHWMTCYNRTLTINQLKSVAVTLGRKAHRPLYLRLLVDELLTWHSYDKTYLRSPPRDVTACIRRHFERLEERDGTVLVTHAFSLLAVSRHGLSEVELEDILSIDDEVLQSEYDQQCPLLHRFPSMSLRRLVHHARYLQHGEADGCRLMFWQHRLFKEATEILYLKLRSDHEKIYINLLVDYFTGRWATTPKLFTYTPKQRAVAGLSCEAEVLTYRYVPRQVNMFAIAASANKPMSLHFNHRKLSELPAALLTLASIDNYSLDSLKRIAKTIIFNFEMMYAYLKCKRGEDYMAAVTGRWVLDKIQNHQLEFVKRELYIVARHLTDNYKYISENPDCAGPFVASQLLNFYGYLPHVTRFIDRVDNVGRGTCALIPTTQQGAAMLSLAHCKVSNHVTPVVDVVVTERFVYSLSNKLVAVSYNQTYCSVAYSVYLKAPEQDEFQLLTSAKQPWTGNCFPEDTSKSNTTPERILLYAALQLRPQIYVIDSSTGDVTFVLKCEEICRELVADRVMYLHVVGDPLRSDHVLCVGMHSGAVVVIDTTSRKLIYRDTKAKPLIGCFDSGYNDGVQVIGYFQATGKVIWLIWTKLAEHFSSRENWRAFVPVISLSELAKTSTEVFTAVYVTDRCQLDRNWDTVHAVLATSHCSIVVAWNVVRIHYAQENTVSTERSVGKRKQSVIMLPSREQLTFVCCDKGGYSCADGKLYVLCGTASRTFVLAFVKDTQHGSILFSFRDTFETVVLEQYVFYGVNEGALTMYEYLEEPFRLFTYGAVEERQGRINKLRCSDGGYLFVTCHEEGAVCLYRSDMVVLLGKKCASSVEQSAAALPIKHVKCGYTLASTLSADERQVTVWDIENCSLKREISFTETVQQFQLSESETHVAVVTASGKLLLYTIDHVDDLPALPILQLPLKVSSGRCWLLTVRSQPGSVVIITEVGHITTINVQTCQTMHDSKSRMPADIDDVIVRNDNVYVIYHSRRVFLAVHPVSGQATWELDMDSKTGKSLQKFGDAILDIAEYDDSVYALITSERSDSLQLNLLCVKPFSNSIFKILDLCVPRSAQFLCAYSNSRHIVYQHDGCVHVIDIPASSVKLQHTLTMPRLTSDGAYLIGVSDKRHLKLYRLADSSCIASFQLHSDIDCIDVSADDEYVTAVARDKQIYAFVIADPLESHHTLTIKKLPSRSHAPLNALETYREHPKYQLLKEMSQTLDETFPQFADIDAQEVVNEPLVEKPDSPIRLHTASVAAHASNAGLITPAPVLKPFVLSYGPANLQTSTNLRLQKIKNKFTEVDFNRPTPDRCVSRGPGQERRRMLMTMMQRAASGRSTAASRAHTVTAASRARIVSSSTSPSKSRMSLTSAKHLHVGMRAEMSSPSKSASVSRSASAMSKTCTLQ